MEVTTIIRSLNSLAEKFRLKKKALKYCLDYLKSEDFHPSEEINLKKIRLEFHSNKLCFEHGLLNYPYFHTTITLYELNDEGGEDEIGWYTLITMVDGNTIDDSLTLDFDNQGINSP